MTHHSVMTSSLRIKKRKIVKFYDFSSDFDYNSKLDHSLLHIRPTVTCGFWTRDAVEDG